MMGGRKHEFYIIFVFRNRFHILKGEKGGWARQKSGLGQVSNFDMVQYGVGYGGLCVNEGVKRVVHCIY